MSSPSRAAKPRTRARASKVAPKVIAKIAATKSAAKAARPATPALAVANGASAEAKDAAKSVEDDYAATVEFFVDAERLDPADKPTFETFRPKFDQGARQRVDSARAALRHFAAQHKAMRPSLPTFIASRVCGP